MKRIATYCYQCVAGPDLLTVKVCDGVATEVEPNFAAADVHPGGGKVCVKAYGLVQKTYHPDRVLRPMKRTNPKKGHDEDPGWTPISWDEALGLISRKLLQVRDSGLLDESGYPRVAPAADGVQAVAGAHLEDGGTALQLGEGGGDRHFHAEEGRREVVDLDARADGILAGIEVREQELAAGDLDVAHQHGRGVNARVLAHEVDGALAVDGEFAGRGDAGGEGGFHRHILLLLGGGWFDPD